MPIWMELDGSVIMKFQDINRRRFQALFKNIKIRGRTELKEGLGLDWKLIYEQPLITA